MRRHHRPLQRGKSKKRRNNKNNTTASERELYSEFVNHVQSEIDSEANPHLEVNESWDTTSVFLRTSLLHVIICDQSLRKDIEGFFPGTELNIKDNPNDEGVVYEVLIPLEAIDGMERVLAPPKGRSVRFAAPPSNEAPSVVNLLIYVILLMFVVFGAALTTTREDWAAVFAFVKK